MRDRVASRLGALMPRRVRQELFEPALRDLDIEDLGRRSAGGHPSLASAVWLARVVALYVDCLRLAPSVALANRADRSSSNHSPLTRMEPFTMLVYNFRHALRLLHREPGFMAAAVLTLALGIGANVAVFAVVEAVVLRPLPYPDADELVIVNHRDQRTGITKGFIALGDFIDLAARQTVLENLNGFGDFDGTIFDVGDPFRVSALVASPGLLEMMRVQAVHGRVLQEGDAQPGAPLVMMLGQEVWQTKFGSDPQVIGRSLRLGQQTRQVVGIAPAGVRFPPQSRAEVIVPLTMPAQAPAQRKSGWTFAAGRLRPGMTVADLDAQLATLSRQMEHDHPSQNQGSLYYALPLRQALVGDTRWPLLLMQAAVVLVLLIACANVGNLLLVRSLARRQEMAVRMALGAGRGRLAVQLMCETIVLCAVGGAAGVALAYWGVPALVALVPRTVNVPGLDSVGINRGVLAFAFGVSLATAMAFGLFAAMSIGRQSAAGALTNVARVGISRRSRRAASILVVTETAVTVVLLVSAGLILRSFTRLLSVDPGFSSDSVLTVDIQLPAERYRDAEARRAFYDRAFEALERTSGVVEVGAAVVTPLTGNNWTVGFERSDQPVAAGQRPPDVGWQSASGGFFTALHIPLRAGRLFDSRDRPGGAQVVIISESIERRFFPEGGAVGRRVRLGDADGEIVGVVGDIRRAGLTDEPRADMYFPFERSPSNSITLFLRTSGDPNAVLPSIRATLRSLEPATAFVEAETMADIAAESLAPTRLTLWLLGVFAIVALALAAIGVYGVMAYAVRQRTREIGTRLALGATGRGIAWMVMREGSAIILTGLAIGLTAGLLAARSLRAMLYSTPATDPMTLTATAGVLVATMLLACYVPARRAATLDPARTLAVH
jgi:putative ABC transport system permease protein